MLQKIVLCSWGQLEGEFSNLGDRLIFESLVEVLRKRYEALSLYVMSGDCKYTESKYAVNATNPFSLKGFLRFLKFIRKSQLVVVGGGELVQDKSSKSYLFFNLLPILLAKLFGRKCVAIAIGISGGAELSSFGRFVSKKTLNLLDAITVREQGSFDNAVAMGIKQDKVFLSSDIVFSLGGKGNFYTYEPQSAQNKGKYIVFSLRDITGRKGGLIPASIKRKFFGTTIESNRNTLNFVELIAKVVDSAISKLDVDVVLWPTYYGKNFSSRDDLIHQLVYEKIENKDRVRKINTPLTFEQIMDMLKGAQMLMGLPLHSLISATLANCPFLALNYAEKGTKFTRQINYCDEMIIDLSQKGFLRQITVDGIIKSIKLVMSCRAQIKDKLAAGKNKLIGLNETNFKILDKILRDDSNA